MQISGYVLFTFTLIFAYFVDESKQSDELLRLIGSNRRYYQQSPRSLFGHHNSHFLNRPRYRRPPYSPINRKEDSTNPSMDFVLHQLFERHQHNQKQRQQKMIDSLVGSFLKKNLLQESKLSRANLAGSSGSLIETEDMEALSNNADEERDWDIALALSINKTVDSLPLEDKMALMSEYYFDPGNKNKDFGEAQLSNIFSEDDEASVLHRSHIYEERQASLVSLLVEDIAELTNRIRQCKVGPFATLISGCQRSPLSTTTSTTPTTTTSTTTYRPTTTTTATITTTDNPPSCFKSRCGACYSMVDDPFLAVALYSPNYPNDYGDSINCTFTIEAGTLFAFRVEEMVIEEGYDSIEFTTPGSTTPFKILTGYTVPEDIITPVFNVTAASYHILMTIKSGSNGGKSVPPQYGVRRWVLHMS